MLPFAAFITLCGKKFNAASFSVDKVSLASHGVSVVSGARASDLHQSCPPLFAAPSLSLANSGLMPETSRSLVVEAREADVPERQRSQSLVEVASVSEPSSGWSFCLLLKQMKDIASVPVFLFLTLAFSAMQFITGGFSFWAPTYLEEVIHVGKSVAGLGLGADVAVAGIVGSIVGGTLLDVLCARASRRAGIGLTPELRSAVACRLAFFFAVLAVPCAAWAAISVEAASFFAALGLAMLVMFAMVPAAVIAMMESVPASLRGLAMATNSLISHALGDLISPVLVGQVKDATGSFRDAIWLLSGWSVFMVLFSGIGCIFAFQKIGRCSCARADAEANAPA